MCLSFEILRFLFILFCFYHNFSFFNFQLGKAIDELNNHEEETSRKLNEVLSEEDEDEHEDNDEDTSGVDGKNKDKSRVQIDMSKNSK